VTFKFIARLESVASRSFPLDRNFHCIQFAFREFSKRGGVLDSGVGFAVVGAAMKGVDYRETRICRLLRNRLRTTDRIA
jgi:hypothetical protein